MAQARHAAPKLGLNIKAVTRNKVVGSLGPDGRLKFLSAKWLGTHKDYDQIDATEVDHVD